MAECPHASRAREASAGASSSTGRIRRRSTACAIDGFVLGLYGGDDVKINEHLDELVRAMVRFKKDFEMRIYPGAAHAFFNDTRGTTYREAAAKDAWERVVRFYRRTLGA